MLRREGEKLPRGEVRAQPEVRGDLVIEPHGSALLATLRTAQQLGHGQRPLALYGARLTRLRGDSLIIVGEEACGKDWENRTQRQAWWCRLDLSERSGPLPGTHGTAPPPPPASTSSLRTTDPSLA